MVNDAAAIADARTAAAEVLRSGGYVREAAIVQAGAGDDFAEVRIALALMPILAARRPQPLARAASGRRRGGEEC